MVKRKGELSQRTIDREWPYQVAITAETCRGDGYLTTRYFCEGLSVCPRQWCFRRDDRDYVVFCFAEAAHAEQFRARFGGEMVLPSTKRRRAD
jgi:hypothetical protein